MEDTPDPPFGTSQKCPRRAQANGAEQNVRRGPSGQVWPFPSVVIPTPLSSKLPRRAARVGVIRQQCVVPFTQGIESWLTEFLVPLIESGLGP